jgi:hypothetical protein
VPNGSTSKGQRREYSPARGGSSKSSGDCYQTGNKPSVDPIKEKLDFMAEFLYNVAHDGRETPVSHILQDTLSEGRRKGTVA